MSKIVSENNIETIHIHDLPLTYVGKVLKDRYDLKLVVDLHENWPALINVSNHTKTLLGRLLSPNFLWVRYEKQILRHADRIIVVVEEARERLKVLGLEGEKISVVSNTLNINEFGFAGSKTEPDFFTLYYAGGINYHRGLQTVIKAISLIKDKIPQIRFRIAGAGSYLHKLKDLVDKLEVEQHLRFLGYLSPREVAANLASADAAMIPHLKTDHTDSTIPHKLFQYMYANKPIIASNCDPLERIIKETNSGLIFKAGSADDLADKIIALFEKKIHIPPARIWVEEKYNWEADAENLIDSYNKL